MDQTTQRRTTVATASVPAKIFSPACIEVIIACVATIHVNLKLDLPTAVPEKLLRLLSIEKKSELQRYCDGISISTEEFVALILNCHQHGYVHDMRWYRKEPEHLRFDPTKIWLMGKYKPGDTLDAGDQKLMRKWDQMLIQRRLMAVHVFVASAERWHVFYFDQRDRHGGHWKHGPHIHFANHLWPEYTLQKVLDIFSTPDGALSGTVHVRFVAEVKPQ